MKILLVFVLALAGCDKPEKLEYKCINNTLHYRNGNVWSEVYSALPCYPVEETK
jgi:hypothetical protein